MRNITTIRNKTVEQSLNFQDLASFQGLRVFSTYPTTGPICLHGDKHLKSSTHTAICYPASSTNNAQ
jgi:hypothetical protein